uniref:Uncharacterized protein n=1 Tax=Rhizophora mucronata TaxID=61149 RepID=A0A2P2QLU9_RHIMU
MWVLLYVVKRLIFCYYFVFWVGGWWVGPPTKVSCPICAFFRLVPVTNDPHPTIWEMKYIKGYRKDLSLVL